MFCPLQGIEIKQDNYLICQKGNMSNITKTAASAKANKSATTKFNLTKGKFWEQYNKLNPADRANLILAWVRAGLVPQPKLVRVTVDNPKNPKIKTSYEVMPQQFAIEGKPVVVSAHLAQAIGNHFKLDLPTREVLTQIYQQAKHIIPGGKAGMERLGLESSKLSGYSQEVADAMKRLNLRPEDIVAGQHKEIFRPLKGGEAKLHAAGWVVPPPAMPKDTSNTVAMEAYRKKVKEWEDKVRKFDSSVIIQPFQGATGHFASHEEYPQAHRYMGKIFVNVTGTEESLTLKELETKAKSDPRYAAHLETITGGRSYSDYSTKPKPTASTTPANKPAKPTAPPPPTQQDAQIQDIINVFADQVIERRIKVAERIKLIKNL